MLKLPYQGKGATLWECIFIGESLINSNNSIMAKLPRETTETVLNLKRQLIDILDEATATEDSCLGA